MLVLIEPFATLLTKPPSVDHLAQQHGRPIFTVPSLFMKHFHDGIARIESDEVGQLQRAHRDVGAVFHDIVDVVFGSNTCLKTSDGFVDIGHQHAVGQEPG